MSNTVAGKLKIFTTKMSSRHMMTRRPVSFLIFQNRRRLGGDSISECDVGGGPTFKLNYGDGARHLTCVSILVLIATEQFWSYGRNPNNSRLTYKCWAGAFVSDKKNKTKKRSFVFCSRDDRSNKGTSSFPCSSYLFPRMSVRPRQRIGGTRDAHVPGHNRIPQKLCSYSTHSCKKEKINNLHSAAWL